MDFTAGPVIKALLLWLGAATLISLVTLLVVSFVFTGGLTLVKRLVSGDPEVEDQDDDA